MTVKLLGVGCWNGIFLLFILNNVITNKQQQQKYLLNFDISFHQLGFGYKEVIEIDNAFH